jgi:transposase InsO family protein
VTLKPTLTAAMRQQVREASATLRQRKGNALFRFSICCLGLGLKHIRTRPYTPKTNGKAEPFIQTALREWAYAEAYPTSQYRTAELPRWLHRDNWHRPHGSLEAQTPISRLGLSEDNLLRLHI